MLPPLPDDVISEILSWVPVKLACRFQCVSRGWRTLISSPAFLATHKIRPEPLIVSVTTSFNPKISSVLWLMDTEGNVIRVIKKVGLWTVYYCFDGPVCLCFNKHYVSVVDLATGNVVRTSAKLDRELSLIVGCAVPSRTYKVVSLGRKNEPCKVIKLEDGAKWRQVQSPPTPSLVTNGHYHGFPITVNGVMHFLYKSVRPNVDKGYVLRFDLESEEWKACIKVPGSGEKLQDYRCMVNLDGALCMIQRTSAYLCLIWVLIDSAKEDTWVKLYTIPMAPTLYSLRPLTVMHDGRKLLFYESNSVRETATLQVYDPLNATCTNVTTLASDLLENYGLCVLDLECLVSPKNLPISAPSVKSRLMSCKWLRRLDPVSLFYK